MRFVKRLANYMKYVLNNMFISFVWFVNGLYFLSCFPLSGHILCPSWDLEIFFVEICSSSFLGLRNIFVGTCSSSFWGLRNIFVGTCSSSFLGLRNIFHPSVDDVRPPKNLWNDLHPFEESYHFCMWTMYIHLRDLIVSSLCGQCTSI